MAILLPNMNAYRRAPGRRSIHEPDHGASTTGGAACGYLIGLAAAAVLSLTGILIALVSTRHGVAALVIAFWRDLFTSASIAAALGIFAPRLLAVRARDLGFLAVNGLVLAFFNILWTLSVVRNGAAAATFLVYSSGGFTVLLGALILREKVGLPKGAAVLASLAGAALVSGVFSSRARAGGSDLTGIVAGLGSGLAYAVYSLVGKVGARRGISAWAGVCYSFAVAALVLAGLRLLPAGLVPASVLGPGELLLPGKPIGAWLLLAALAAGPTALGFGLYNASLARLAAGTANLLASTEPLFTLVVAYLFLGERLAAGALAGGALILAAVVLLWLGESRAARSRAPRGRARA